jgi:hypothetical protein
MGAAPAGAECVASTVVTRLDIPEDRRRYVEANGTPYHPPNLTKWEAKGTMRPTDVAYTWSHEAAPPDRDL